MAPVRSSDSQPRSAWAELSDSSVPGMPPRNAVAVVEGTGPKLSEQIAALLAVRLRIAAIILLVSGVAFLLKAIFSGQWPGNSDPFLFWYHSGVVAVVGLVTGLLFFGPRLSLNRLRLVEEVLFMMPMTFFFAAFYLDMIHYAQQNDAGMVLASVKTANVCWYALIFIYGMFIPNTDWRRAALALYGFAAAGILMAVIGRWQDPVIALAVTLPQLSEVVLVLLIGASIASIGSHRFNLLRQEVFEARQLGQYRLGQMLGSGGAGEVYLAEHTLLKRPCAIKLIRAGRHADATTLNRFEREVRATAGLSHWNTVEIFDYGRTDDGTFYYVMEYLPGMNLRELVDRFGPLPADRTIYMLRQMCEALQEAHSQGLIHRDIKPANVYVAQRGGVYDVVKLLDFGLVRHVTLANPGQTTQDGAILGSPLFMAPEQALGDREPDGRTDIYSVGCVAYFMLTGRPPFDGDRVLKVLIAHAHDAVTPPRQLRPDIPADLERIILGCLAKQPDARFRSVEQLERALAGCEAASRWTRQQAARWWQEREPFTNEAHAPT